MMSNSETSGSQVLYNTTQKPKELIGTKSVPFVVNDILVYSPDGRISYVEHNENDYELKKGNIEKVFFGYLYYKQLLYNNPEGESDSYWNTLPRWLLTIKMICIELDISTSMEISLYNKVYTHFSKVLEILLEIMMFIKNNPINFTLLEEEYNNYVRHIDTNLGPNVMDNITGFYKILKQCTEGKQS